MTLKFLPIDTNRIETNHAIGFNAYYDKNIVSSSKWRSVGATHHFLISANPGSEELEFHASGSNVDGGQIGWVKGTTIDKQGFSRGAWTQETETINSGTTYVISPSDHGKHLRFKTFNEVIITDFPTSIFPIGFYFDISRGNVVDAIILKPLGATVLQCGEVLVAGHVVHAAYLSTSSKLPGVLTFQKVRVQRISSFEWLVFNGQLVEI